MRHLYHHRKLGVDSEHRWALLRNLAQSLFEHGAITTTFMKAKTVRPFCERLIRLAVHARKHRAGKDSAKELIARRQIHKLLGERSIIPAEHRATYDAMSDAERNRTLRMASGRRHRTGDPKGRLAFTGESVTNRLIEKIAPRFENRPGGYTRIVRLPGWRIGDAAPLAQLRLIGDDEAPGAVTKPEKTARKRRADARYALAIKLNKAGASRDKDKAAS